VIIGILLTFDEIGSDGLWDGISIADAVTLATPYVELDMDLASQVLNEAGLAGLEKAELDDNITNILISIKH
jgi:hypothetical protein